MNLNITPGELKSLIESGSRLMVIDVRSKEEYKEKHLPFASNLPIEIIESGHFIPEPAFILIMVCGKGGGRSERAATWFKNNTSNETYFLEGGTFGWPGE